jgi:hypothetical protein
MSNPLEDNLAPRRPLTHSPRYYHQSSTHLSLHKTLAIPGQTWAMLNVRILAATEFSLYASRFSDDVSQYLADPRQCGLAQASRLHTGR